MAAVTLKLLRIEMTGARPFYDAEVRRGVIDALLAHPRVAPEIWSTKERGGLPFDYEKAVKYRTGAPDGVTLFLRRKKAVTCQLTMFLHRQPSIIVDFDPVPDVAFWPELYALADDFANAYEPDLLWVRPRLERVFDADDARSRALARLAQCGTVAPIAYRKKGIAGLGLRTVLGPLLIRQIGAERLSTLPAPAVTKLLPWGGISIDLMPDPWTRSLEELSDSWAACMTALEPSGFFSPTTLNADGDARYTRPDTPGWDPGGLVR
jgi:hypothetical protein